MASMTTLEELPYTVEFRLRDNADGTPGAVAQVDGIPVHTSSDDTIAVAVPAADGMSGVFRSVARGIAKLTVVGDADMGSGVISVPLESEDCAVLDDPSLQASTGAFTFGAAVPKSP